MRLSNAAASEAAPVTRSAGRIPAATSSPAEVERSRRQTSWPPSTNESKGAKGSRERGSISVQIPTGSTHPSRSPMSP